MMLLFVVISAAAIISPTFSQLNRAEGFDEADYPLGYFHDRPYWNEALERPLRPGQPDIENILKNLEAMGRVGPWAPRQRRNGKLGDPLGIQLFGTSKRFDGMRWAGAEKRNFDEIDRSGFNGFVKKNFDEIDRSGFNSLVKKNFDEIDRNSFNGFVKRSANDAESPNH